MSTALVLAGHGSHISPHTGGLIWQHVDSLRALGIADEVTAAFWKEQPSFSTVLRTLTSTDVTIIPVFTAQGYFTRTVIPTEIGLDGPITLLNSNTRTLRYARTLSEHPCLSRIVQERVQSTLQSTNLKPEETAVAIIGHSTRRHPESRKAAEYQAAQLAAEGVAAEVVAVFLDDDPAIPAMYGLTRAPNIIAVPFFVAAGSHTTIDVPARLGLEHGQSSAVVQGRNVFYTAPIGTDESLLPIILELAKESGAPLKFRGPISNAAQDWAGFPAVGRTALIDAVQRAGALRFGQLLLTPHEVRPIDEGARTVIHSPDVLRDMVRQPAGGFRSLATSDDLPGGWLVPIDHPHQIHAVVETVYPGAVADWASSNGGEFAVDGFSTVMARQTGMFRSLSNLDEPAQAAVVERICGRCVRHPSWFLGRVQGALPCTEPCNHWLSEALNLHESTKETLV